MQGAPMCAHNRPISLAPKNNSVTLHRELFFGFSSAVSVSSVKSQKKERKMNNMTAYCGINCATCDAYIAAKNDDDKKRKETAESWSKMYQSEIKAEDINCIGCTSGEEPLFNHCHVCEMRKCGLEKGVVNCAHCSDYPCEALAAFFKMVPDAKKNLDAIKAGLK